MPPTSYKEVIINIIEKSYNLYLKSFRLEEKDIHCNEYLINEVLNRYFMDQDRFQMFHDSKLFDCHKMASYLTYWICKIKPFSITSDAYIDSDADKKPALYIVNEVISFFVAVGCINAKRIKSGDELGIFMPRHVIQPFFYTLRYRYINPDPLAIIYYFLDDMKIEEAKALL